MKQQITTEQLKELSDAACDRLLRWLLSKRYERHLNIGQMIEFMDEHTNVHWYGGWIMDGSWGLEIPDAVDLCDELWKLVKEELEK